MSWPLDRFERRHEPGVWGLIHRILVLLIAAAVVTFILCAFYPLLEKQQQARDENEKLEGHIDAEQQNLTRQHLEIAALKTNPQYQEMIIRERFDLMKRGETIFRFETGKVESQPK